MAANVIALVFTVAFARMLGASGYGTLAALVSTFLILQVPGSALQITVAREVSTAIALGAGGARRGSAALARTDRDPDARRHRGGDPRCATSSPR